MLRVCPKCLTASNEDAYCPNDGTRLVDPDELHPSGRKVGESAETVPNVPPAPTPDGAPEIRTSPVAHTRPSGADPLIGQLVGGRYRVLGQLGEGGMGNVFRAVQETIEKKVALKVLKAEYSASPDMVVRFHREAVSACRIKHPNVVDVFDLGQLDDGRFFLAMELLEGRDLAQVLSSAGPMAPSRAVHVVLQICRALNAAHQSGIVHRDLKPENVFLHRTSDGDEIVKIVDFGIAHLLAQEPERAKNVPTLERAPDGSRKLTSVGMIFGTPEYMAPEQATGARIDHRADIYATGVILYKMLTGQAPFSGSNFLDVLAKQVGEEPPRMSKVNPNLDIPKELERVVMRSLAKKPDDRFADMARFARALAFASRRLKSGRKSRKMLLAGAALLVGGVAVSVWLWRRQARTESVISLQPDPTRIVAAAPVETKPIPSAIPSSSAVEPAAQPPAPDPSAQASALDAAAAPASASAAPVASTSPVASAPAAPSAKPMRETARPSPKKTEPVVAPPRSTPPAPTSLPGLERCFETVAGERREVPCN